MLLNRFPVAVCIWWVASDHPRGLLVGLRDESIHHWHINSLCAYVCVYMLGGYHEKSLFLSRSGSELTKVGNVFVESALNIESSHWCLMFWRLNQSLKLLYMIFRTSGCHTRASALKQKNQNWNWLGAPFAALYASKSRQWYLCSLSMPEKRF